MKKIISVSISLILLITSVFSTRIITLCAQVTDIEKTQLGSTQTYYSFDAGTKTLTISGSGETPDYVNNSSSQPWYLWRSDGSIENVVVEEGITRLGSYFLFCVCAQSISLPQSLEKIGSYALAGNNLATEIKLGNNLKTISNNAFYMCIKLERVSIPKSVTYIGSGAFEECTILNCVEFGSMNMSLSISSRAFMACGSLKSIDIPKEASLAAYSVGYKSQTVGDIYTDLSVGVYRDSGAYSYATNNNLNCRILDSMVIYEGDIISCNSYSNSTDITVNYFFTPKASSYFSFSSSGAVDVDCILSDSLGSTVAQSTDISQDNLNFSISCQLNAGEQYCYTVTSRHSAGDYTLSLVPADLDRVEIDWSFSYTADLFEDGSIDIAALIDGKSVNFIYESGYIHSVPFKDGGEFAGYTMSYNNLLNSRVTCGTNTDSITVGEQILEFSINIEHSYTQAVIPPTFSNGGYTLHTCVLCGKKYTSDFTEQLSGGYFGKVYIMSSPDNSYFSQGTAAEIDIYDLDGKKIGTTDENGYFYVTAYQAIVIKSEFGPARTVAVDKSNRDLGSIPIVLCDFNNDGYVNAKDYSIFKTAYGGYDKNEDLLLASLDINKDGIIDDNDWEYALSFAAYGKIDESIYNTAE